MNNVNERLVWIDVETTGLNPKKDLLLEVAMVITDRKLNVLEERSCVIFHDQLSIQARLTPVTWQMHTNNGLLQDVKHSSFEMDAAEVLFLDLLQVTNVPVKKGILAGSSVHFDRAFLRENMPLLEAFFYHRMFDVSALKTAAQMWRPELVPDQMKAHRAMDDIKESIALAQHFRDKFFREPV